MGRAAPPIARLIIRQGLLLTGALLALFAALTVLHEVANRRTELQGYLQALTGMVAHNSEAAVMFGNGAEAAGILASLAASPDVVQGRLFLPDGTTLATYQGPGGESACQALHADGSGLLTRWCGMALYRPVVRHGQHLGIVGIEVSLASTYRALLGTLLLCALAAVVAYAAAVPMWRRLARRIAGPLDGLVEVTRQVRLNEDYSRRFDADANAEAQALSEAFNGMLAQLQLRDERLNTELAQRRLAERRLNDLAYADAVTGLNNRHYFMERIEQSLARATQPGEGGALLYLDLDGFKQINDELGHEWGDELLSQVGQRLRRGLRSSDVVCRLGGDEFAVILERASDLRQIESLATKLLTALAAPYPLGPHVGRISASMGICLYPGPTEWGEQDRETLLRSADLAMYKAKQEGRNCFRVYQAERGDAVVHRQAALHGSLLEALSQDELTLDYQPQVDLQTQACFAMEALLRWHHPTLGTINPVDFIAIAESSGQIVPIGEWVLEQACAQLVAWRRTQPGLRMGVNLSPVQLAQEPALERLCEVLAESGLPPGAVDLELTESLLVDRSPTMQTRLARLRSAGFGLAIDDFGVGYSSLAYLERFPITTLKIDRAFVSPLKDDAQRPLAILEAIIAVGHALGTEVVAEGIEAPGQVERLLQMGCRLGQGHLFARPMAAPEATQWLQGQAPAGEVTAAQQHRAAPELAHPARRATLA